MPRKKSKRGSRKRKQWRPNDSPARWRAVYKKYGLSRDEYIKIFQSQNGRCFICFKSPDESRPRRNLAVDHDHATGRIRGLLCFNCNHRLLGQHIRDDLEKAKRILEYLTRETNYGTVPKT